MGQVLWEVSWGVCEGDWGRRPVVTIGGKSLGCLLGYVGFNVWEWLVGAWCRVIMWGAGLWKGSWGHSGKLVEPAVGSVGAAAPFCHVA